MIQTQTVSEVSALAGHGDVIVNPRLTALIVDLDRSCRRLSMSQGELIAALALVLRGLLNTPGHQDLRPLVGDFLRHTDTETEGFVWELVVCKCGLREPNES